MDRVVLQRRSGVAAPGGFFLCLLIGVAVVNRAWYDADFSWGTAFGVMAVPVLAWIVGVLRTPHLVILRPQEWAVEVSTGRGPLRTAKRISGARR